MNLKELIQPETERLQLRQWIESDLDAFAVMSADPRVMAFFPDTLNRKQSNSIAIKCRTLLAERGWGVWAVELKQTRQFIGMVGLHTPSANLPFSPCVEVLWRLAPSYWGQGYATVAARAALQVGFDVLAVDEIVSFAVLDNVRSRAVMERLNMVNSGETFIHPDVPEDSHLREHCVYKLSRDQWKSRNQI